ncbi:MAG TPA: DinB family protein [Methylomirabilota bacterium]
MTGLAPQLEDIDRQLADARRRAHDVAARVGPERWGTRPAPEEWSVAECLIHLNLTSRAFLPLIRDATFGGRAQNLLGDGPYRRDVVGWVLCWIMEPPARFRIKTTAPFVPGGVESPARILEMFDGLQDALRACVREVHGLDLGRLRLASPFNARLKYNLYSCLRLIPAHQRQHLVQAENVVDSLRAVGGGG